MNKKYFYLKDIIHKHSLIKNLGNVYSIPKDKDSLQLPKYKRKSRTSIKYMCSITWSQIVKELSIEKMRNIIMVVTGSTILG